MNIVYVDEEDRVIGAGSKAAALAGGKRTRTSRIILFNAHNQVLLQQRSATVVLPLLWDNSAAGYVDEGETYTTSAYRELSEEMGITKVKLKEIAHYYCEETDEPQPKRRFTTLFVGLYDGPIKIDDGEVANFAWLSMQKIEESLIEDPASFTEGCRISLDVFKSYNLRQREARKGQG